MRTCGIIPLQDVNEWRNALCTVPHAIAHTWEHCYAMHLTSGLETFLYHFADGDTQGVCAFAERQHQATTDIASPPGFAGFAGSGYDPTLLHGWNRLMLERGYICGYVALHPTVSKPVWFNHGLQAYSTTYVLDLTSPLDELYRRMSQNRKDDLRRARHDGIRVWVDTPAVKNFFVRRFDEVFRLRGAASAHYLSPATLNFLSTLESFVFVGAGRDEVEAVKAFAFTPYAADGLYNVSFGSRRSLHTIMIWTGIQELQARRIPALNLGSGVRPNDGVARYKRYLGATEQPLLCLKQVYDCERFASLCSRAGVDAEDAAGYFPPYRAGLGKG